eukprot:GGOE01053047.1.p1 GENE.GGOE01053047.1~~GGOE01053047.1.p1  ORF type:complete len:194 (-),score=77.96 GGOE01053047.1:165-692(-)
MTDFLHKVDALIVLGPDGKRVFAKYWGSGFPTHAKQMAFEKTLFAKTVPKKEGATVSDAGDIAIFETHAVVFKAVEETYFYAVSAVEENELVILNVLTCFCEALAQLLKNKLDPKSLLSNFEVMLLVADEMVDDGVLLEINPQNVAKEVQPHSLGDHGSPLSTLHTMAKIVKQNL